MSAAAMPDLEATRKLARLAPPEGHFEVAKAIGKGVQMYTFDPKTMGWSAPLPCAFLFDEANTLVATHHRSGKTPVWEFLENSVSRAFPPAKVADDTDKSAIPWLLLDADANAIDPNHEALLHRSPSGGEGGDGFSVTFIQRIYTKGGIPPVEPPAPGAVAAIPYEAEYVFFAKTTRVE